MERHERIIVDIGEQEIKMLNTIRSYFKEKHGVEVSHGALLRDLIDIEYIRITEEKEEEKYDE